ncbi:hypothetical protein FACS1894211_02260 [Clostridia bacterium]|nr:hypothetical protein FACS1894211_02260 [Clostridia bacterium]
MGNEKSKSKGKFKFRWAKGWESLCRLVFPQLREDFIFLQSDLGYFPQNPRMIAFYTENHASATYVYDADDPENIRRDLTAPVSDLIQYKFYKDYTLYSPNVEAAAAYFNMNPSTSSCAFVKIPHARSEAAEKPEINLSNRKETEAIKTMDSSPAERDIPDGDYTLFGMCCDLNESAPVMIQEFIRTFTLRMALSLDKLVRGTGEDDLYEILPDMQEILRDVVSDLLRNYCDPDLINILSGSLYERQEVSGGILFSKNKSQIRYNVVFGKQIEFELKNLRQIRKLLQMTGRSNFLVISKNKVTGLGSSLQNIRTIRFAGHQKWTLSHGNDELLRYWRGKFTIPVKNGSYFPKNVFAGERNDKFANQQLIGILKKQEHGALVVISDPQNIMAETERLSGLDRGYKIEPINLKHTDAHGNYDKLTLMRNLTSIDGAILMDTNFVVYGVGLILDGIALNGGSSARGARYNSSKCYLDNRKKTGGNFAAVVVSEDESIDILLNYTPEEPRKRTSSAAAHKAEKTEASHTHA